MALGTAGVCLFPLTVAASSSPPMYDAIPNPLPSDVTSMPFEGTGFFEIGDRLALQPGTDRKLDSATVTLSSWACESGNWYAGCTSRDGATFPHPITFNVYSVSGSGPSFVPGAVIATVTQIVNVPYRPSADSTCTDGAGNATASWKGASGQCVYGYTFNATFDFSALNVTLPDDVIVGVAFDTNTSGYHPVGSPGPYDALNVALLAGSAPAAGQDTSTSELYLAGDITGGDLIQIGVGGVGFPVRLDTAPSVPTTTEQCKKGGYADFGFSNQGQCVSSVVANRGGTAKVR